MLWTAHGVKIWPAPAPVNMTYMFAGEDVVRAMPRLSSLLSDEVLHVLGFELEAISIGLHEISLSQERDVRRIPLKPTPLSPSEAKYMATSLDGLSAFEPVDIYNVNIQAYSGLLRSIKHCQSMEGFGLQGGPKTDSYSAMLLDVSTFWMTFRLLYSFTGLAPILCDMFLILGPWHNYMYSHVCVWSEFRSSFLASAFFHLFPNQNLFLRPRLMTSSTFFTWLRLSYPYFRPLLLNSLNTIKFLRTTYDIQYTVELKRKKKLPKNPYETPYLTLYNLYYLFEFVLPAIADYGAALKLNDWQAFRDAYLRLFRFFLGSKSQGLYVGLFIFFVGVLLYTRSMFIFFGLLEYWKDKGLPIFEMFRRSPTFFSEESGELGLSLLTKSRPVNMRCDYEQTRKSWLLVKQMYTASNEARQDSKTPEYKKSYRRIGNSLLVYLSYIL